VGGAVRYLYNYFLKVNIDEYQATKKFVWYNQMATELVDLKKQHTWLTETYSQVMQSGIKDLDTALKNMKKTGTGFPKFKSKYTIPVSFRYQQHVVVDNNTLHLPKIGHIKIVLHRALPPFTSVAVTQTPRGWYASFVVDVQEQQLVNHITNPVGVDVNSKFTALSTGELIANPKPLARKIQHIKNQQRKLSRKQKTLRNRQKAKNRLARIHDQVCCQRLDHTHQLSARIAKSYDLVSVETLKIDEMKRKSKPVAKAIADTGWALFASAIVYKCKLKGYHFVKINQWLPQ
jgi:putative transposase